jgi:hypothetical protein
MSIAAAWAAEHDIIAAEPSVVAHISREMLETALGGPIT